MDQPPAPGQEKHETRVLALKAVLLVIWALAGFGAPFFARDLDFTVGPWPFGYWMAAQGAVLVFIAIVAVYAFVMRRLAPEDDLPAKPGGPSA
jgi:putative solute:sodium symporter small subunit